MIVIAVVMFTQVSISVAFKGNTHIWVGNEVLNDLKLNDCKVSIEPFGLFRVNDDICNSLIKYPQSYLLGNIAPDGFPDVVGGQMTVHPGLKNGWRTDDWLMKLVGALPKDGPLNDGVTGEKAFVYGYLAHAAADAFSHTYVNTYAGGFFLLTMRRKLTYPLSKRSRRATIMSSTSSCIISPIIIDLPEGPPGYRIRNAQCPPHFYETIENNQVKTTVKL